MAWSFKFGWPGNPHLKPDELAIDIIDPKDLHSDLWICPAPMAAVVRMAKYMAAEKVRTDIRRIKDTFENVLKHGTPPCETGLASQFI